jgi:hypothetical protein
MKRGRDFFSQTALITHPPSQMGLEQAEVLSEVRAADSVEHAEEFVF